MPHCTKCKENKLLDQFPKRGGSWCSLCCRGYGRGYMQSRRKDPNPTDMIEVHTASLKEVLVEIAKCELVCANCHRVRTRDRRRGVESVAA